MVVLMFTTVAVLVYRRDQQPGAQAHPCRDAVHVFIAAFDNNDLFIYHDIPVTSF